MEKFEELQVKKLSETIYQIYGKGLQKEDFISDCWVVYLERKRQFGGTIIPDYWTKIAFHMIEKADHIRAERNRQYGLESRLSLNQKCKDSKEEISSVLFSRNRDFTKGVELWDFVRRLESVKSRIVKYIIHGESEQYIMNNLKLSEDQYNAIRKELQVDLHEFINS